MPFSLCWHIVLTRPKRYIHWDGIVSGWDIDAYLFQDQPTSYQLAMADLCPYVVNN